MSVPRSLPAVLEAAKLGSRAAKCGFDWPEIEGLFTKLAEETSELKEAMASEKAPTTLSSATLRDIISALPKKELRRNWNPS